MDEQEAQWLLARLVQAPTETPNQTWRWLSKEILSQKIPFAVHQLLHGVIYDQWDETELGPTPVWVPSEEEKARNNISVLIPGDDFSAVHHYSVRQPELYWAKVFSALRIRLINRLRESYRRLLNKKICNGFLGPP